MRTSGIHTRAALAGFSLAVVLAATGCQSDFNGQTLPSAWWQTDDVQYFPPGTEFRLSREAAAMNAAKENAALGAAPLGGPAPAPAPVPMQVPAPLGVPMGAPAEPVPPPGGLMP
ncbi:MAG TPA: hypothetical protein VG713_05130 [Pirellulales bacterium]|jgi:hypothetical protein|nr:hypothetical protein [Pirellulales bacterium]